MQGETLKETPTLKRMDIDIKNASSAPGFV
jgi:hypothetical protein